MYVFQNHQGAVLAADAEHVFFLRGHVVDPRFLYTAAQAPPEVLAAAEVAVPRAKIKFVQSIENDAFPILVEGTEPDLKIEFECRNHEAQAAFTKFIFLNMGFVPTESKATLMQAAPGLVVTAIGAAVMTIILAVLAVGIPPEEVAVGRRARATHLILAAVIGFLGPIGVLVVGGLVTGLALLFAFLTYFQGFRILRLAPEQKPAS